MPASLPVKAPAPLYDDPIWHGPADPTIIWNEAKHEWLMYYTQRRATLNPVHQFDWCHGTALGIASSPDLVAWKYEGICQGDKGLGDPMGAGVSWWAPGVYFDGGVYHMYVVCVDGGIHTDFSGNSSIDHFTSTDGFTWTYQSTPKLSSKRCIDPCIAKIKDTYYMWYKDEVHGSHIWAATSSNLNDWTVAGSAVSDRAQEAPLVWKWKERYWMMTDPWHGLGIYSSPNGIDHWTYNTTILSKPGTRAKDNEKGHHPFVQTMGDRAFVFYFVHYLPKDPVYSDRRTVIQIAELKLDADGIVTCDRNAAIEP